MTIAPNADAEKRANLSDWLAVAAGTLGTMMALVDVSIVNASLPVIQGEIGATRSEATWVATAYLVAEIVVIPLTAWLDRLLGLRRLLLFSTILFTFFSVICGLASDLPAIVFGRIGQGLAGGVLIPTALTIVAKRLPPAQQAVGLAMTASAALIGPIVGPLVGGWLTEHISWRFAFFINLPICLVQLALLFFSMPNSSCDWSELRKADWLGVAGTIIGLGAGTTLLEEGHREQWFDSPPIWQLAFASVFGIVLIAIGQFTAKRPVVRLSLLLNPSLASAFVLMMAVGALLYTCLFVTPQFLAAIAGYNALQSGQVAFISGLVAIPSAFCYPVLAKFLDQRLIVGGSMLAISIAALIAGRLTIQSSGADFTATQLLYGLGTTLCAIPLQQVVIASVSTDDAAEANSLSAVSRNLGGSIGLAAIASLQDQRLELHHWQLHSFLSANDIDLQQQIAAAAAALGGGDEGLQAAYRMLDQQIMAQALVMTFNDMFLVLAILGALCVPLVLLLRPAKGGMPAMLH